MNELSKATVDVINVLGDLWLVVGSTGYGMDFSEWTVCAYADLELAQKHCELAFARAQEWDRESSYSSPPNGWNQYDPAQRDDGETNYSIKKLELRSDLPIATEVIK